MKRIYKAAGALLMSAALVTGCGGGKEKYTFREDGIRQLDEGNYEAAIQSFAQALEHSDKTVGTFELDVLKYRAEAEYELEDYAAAAHTYGVLMQADEEKPEYLNRRCILLVKAGELDLAAEDYQKCFEKNSDKTAAEPALTALGQALVDADRLAEAMTLYQQAKEGGLQSSNLYNLMGLCELEAGNCDQALLYFEEGEGLKDVAVLPKLLYNRAAAYEQKQDFAKALELLETYVSSYGSTPEIEKEIAFLKTR